MHIQAGRKYWSRIGCKLMLYGLFALFCLRVVGQALVAFCNVPFLPPMEEWFSGLLPYPQLLCCQILIIVLGAKICLDFRSCGGFFFRINNRLGRFLQNFAALYLVVMVLRYVIHMGLYPSERWMGGSIPIFFHCVLALFLLTLASHHLQGSAAGKPFSPKMHVLLKTVLAVRVTCIILWVVYQCAPSVMAQMMGMPGAAYAVRAEKSSRAEIEAGEPAFSADVYHPIRLRQTPTLLLCTRSAPTWADWLRRDLVGRILAERGYTVVIRSHDSPSESNGRGSRRMNDAHALIDTERWIAHQNWYNGQIYRLETVSLPGILSSRQGTMLL